MGINIVNQIISCEGLKDDLMIFGDFDCDANGSNGLDFVTGDAKEAGYKTDLEYWSDLAKEAHDNCLDGDPLYKAIEVFAEHLLNNWRAYSGALGYSIDTEISNDGYLVTFAYTNE